MDTLDNFGVHIIAAWELLDYLASLDPTVVAEGMHNTGTTEVDARSYPHVEYQAFPRNWDGESWLP